jgi:hypothetical protein
MHTKRFDQAVFSSNMTFCFLVGLFVPPTTGAIIVVSLLVTQLLILLFWWDIVALAQSLRGKWGQS